MNEVPVGFLDLERIESGEARGVVNQSVQSSEVLGDRSNNARISATLSMLA